MNILLRISLTVAFFLILDFYVFQAIKVLTTRTWVWRIFWVVNIAFVVWMIYLFFNFRSMTDQRDMLYAFSGAFILFFVPKLFIAFFLLLEDAFRLLSGVFSYFYDLFSGGDMNQGIPSRRRFISQAALLVAALPFTGTLHGIFKGRYNFKLREEEIFFDELPEAFDGLKIVQISDLHIGSFSSRDLVQKGLDLIIEQNPDLLLFTGDMVNNEAREIRPFIDQFKALKARYGKFSVLGNHDYGDYIQWDSPEAKHANMVELQEQQKEMGFRLLLDEHISIERGDDKLHILGVENWGHGFGERGDLNKALAGLDKADFKVLMSHDPSHWEKVVRDEANKVHLTLSGHTHGMQFGVEIPGFKWSPVRLRYKTWAGLYKEFGRYIYVNRGFGFIGFPGRVGIWPEITSIILRKRQ